MIEEFQSRYEHYKAWIKQRHLFEDTWVRNWDMQKNQLAGFGKRDSLFYTTIYLTALALEENEPEFNEILNGLNNASYAKGMYPRHPGEFDVSKDPYHTLLLALTYGKKLFPNNSLISHTITNIIEGIRENNYKLQNPPDYKGGGPTTHGNMVTIKPLLDVIEGNVPFTFYFSLGASPFYSWMINMAHKAYYNNFMTACIYLIFHLYLKKGLARSMLKLSAKGFANVNYNNPFFDMIRDLLCGDKANQAEIEAILHKFPTDHLPQDLDHITHSDMMWQRDPRDWPKDKQKQEHEYSGADFMILFQFYRQFYVEDNRF